MDKEKCRQTLQSCFHLTPNQVDEASGRGYRLRLQANWPVNNCEADNFRIQLVGINPLTGGDVEKDGIIAILSFDRMMYETDVLTYHGDFRLRCTATLYTGEEILFREQEITLCYPKNAPYVEYRFTPQHPFTLVELSSNCWETCRGNLWLHFDGHDQPVTLPMGIDRRLRFLIPTTDTPEITLQGNMAALRNGR